jgi:hypothetical protein
MLVGIVFTDAGGFGRFVLEHSLQEELLCRATSRFGGNLGFETRTTACGTLEIMGIFGVCRPK